MEERKNELSVEKVRQQINRPDLSNEEIKEIIATLKELAEIAYCAWQYLRESGQEGSFLEEIRKRESNQNKPDLQ